jgi:hypothetical protein
MPKKYVEELKNLPRDVLSFTKANSDASTRPMSDIPCLTVAKEPPWTVHGCASH